MTIRVYDLARELKQDTKRIIEDLRREGADISVPSNSVSHELAKKIRSKYFPKVDTVPKRTFKIVKKKMLKKAENPVDEEISKLGIAPQEEMGKTREKIIVKPFFEETTKNTVRKIRKLQKKVEIKPLAETVIVKQIKFSEFDTECGFCGNYYASDYIEFHKKERCFKKPDNTFDNSKIKIRLGENIKNKLTQSITERYRNCFDI